MLQLHIDKQAKNAKAEM